MKAVLIFDADNTLWDTYEVFRSARLSLLQALARAGLLVHPESHAETLRMIDEELMEQVGRTEYDFKLLAIAMVYLCSQGLSIKEAVHGAITSATVNAEPRVTEVVEQAHLAFEEGLRHLPLFYSDTESVLSAIRASNSIVTVLFSEGDFGRLEHILRAYDITQGGLFDEIIIGPKSKEAFEEAREIGIKLLAGATDAIAPPVILIGDSLHRDIKPGNQAGLITVYKPSPFKGNEEPYQPDERPDYTITRLSELPTILTGLNIPL